jgi:hypothetical protein
VFGSIRGSYAHGLIHFPKKFLVILATLKDIFTHDLFQPSHSCQSSKPTNPPPRKNALHHQSLTLLLLLRNRRQPSQHTPQSLKTQYCRTAHLSSCPERSSGLTKTTPLLLGTLEKYDKGVDHHLPSSGQTDFMVIGCQEEKKALPRVPRMETTTVLHHLRRIGLFAIALKFCDFFVDRLLQPFVLIELCLNGSRGARGSAALVTARSSWPVTSERQNIKSI